jgi:predicted lipoprotein
VIITAGIDEWAHKGHVYGECMSHIDSDLMYVYIPKNASSWTKMSATHKGKKNTPEQKAKISAKLKGRVLSEETKKKMSDARKKLWAEKKKNDSR